MELDTILNILIKFNLTADELLLIYLAYISQSEHGDKKLNGKYFQKWLKLNGRDQFEKLIESLKTKKVVLSRFNPDDCDPDDIEFNKNFISQYFKLSGELGKQLENVYPKTMIVDGKIVFLNHITKKFLNPSEFYFWYSTTIGHSVEKHKEILDLIKWAKSHGLLHYSLIEFVGSRKWETLKYMKDKGISEEKATTYDQYSM